MNNDLLTLLWTQTWQIAALAMIVKVVVKLAARNRPHLAHALWILVLIKCVTPPLWGHSLGVFSRMQTLIEHVSDAPTTDADSIAAFSVLPAEVTKLQEPVLVEDALVPLTEFPPPQDDIANVPERDAEQFDVATNQEWPVHQEFVSDDSTAQSANVGWATIMLWTVVFGAIATLLITIVRCACALRLIHRHRTTELDDALNDRLQQLATQLRIRRVPRIVVSDVLFGPAVLGLLRPAIVLPRCLFEPLTIDERSDVSRPIHQRSPAWEKQTSKDSRPAARRGVTIEGREDLHFLDPVLAHELLHIRRGDLVFGMLQVIAQCLWWFHPAVWFLNRWLSREAERCCDEQVIAELGCSPGRYARSLLAVIESKHTLQPIPVFPGMKPVEITTQRMERIMSLKFGLNKRTPLWCWLSVVALAIVVLPGGAAQTSAEEPVGDEASTVQDTVSPNSSEIEIAEEPLPGNRPDRVQSIYDASELITRMAKERSVDRMTAGESVRAVIEQWLNSAGNSRAAPILPWKVTLDEERLVSISPSNQSRHFIETVSLFEKHGFESFLVEVQAFELPNQVAESILDAATVVSPVEATPAPPSETEAAALATAPKPIANLPNRIEADRRIRATLMSDAQMESLRQKASAGSVPVLADESIAILNGQVGQFRQLGATEFLADVGLDVRVKRLDESLISLKCALQNSVKERFEGEKVSVQSAVELTSAQWLVFQALRKKTGDDQFQAVLMAVRVQRFDPSAIAATPVGISNSKQIGSRLSDAVSPELEQIISDWTAASGKIEHRQGDVLRRIYDEVYETESLSHGKFRFESPQNWSINFAPVEITKVMTEQREQGTIPSKTGRNGRPFRLISSEAEAWTRENRNLVEVNGKNRSTHTLELPADYQGGALIDQLLPLPLFIGPHTFVWSWNENSRETSSRLPGVSGMPDRPESLVKLVKERFAISLLRPIEPGSRKAHLNILPRLNQDAAIWSSIQVILDLQTNLPSAVRIEDPAGAKTTVYSFSGLNVNSIGCEFSSTVPQGSVGAPVNVAAEENTGVERRLDDADSTNKYLLAVYPIADLIIPVPPTINTAATQSDIKDSDLERAAAEDPSLHQESLRATPADVAKLAAQVSKADFAPFVELIKASVEPESWGNRGEIAEDIQTRSLVIRQTVKAHEEIAELIMKLRNGQDANVQIASLLVHLTNEEQLKLIEDRNTLHSLADGIKWALLTPKRSESLTKALLDQKPETISSPKITTISGQAAMIMVGSMDMSVFSGIKLTITPQLLQESSIIRLRHAVTIATDRQPNESTGATVNGGFVLLAGQDLFNPESVVHESLVGSGQTLLLLIEQARTDDDAITLDHYVLLLTPEHVVKEKETLDGGK